MNNPIAKILLTGLLVLAIIAPFAGLAPVMLVLLASVVVGTLWSLLQTLFLGGDRNEAKSDTRHQKANNFPANGRG